MSAANTIRETLVSLYNGASCYAASPGAMYIYAGFAVVGALSIFSLVLPWLWTFCSYRPQNLKFKYMARWAIVTGGSSGIGRSLCFQLAKQGLNLVIAAVPDALLEKTTAELRASFPQLEIRTAGVNLSSANPRDYMDKIEEVTSDIDVQIVFNNAGYMVTGFFDATPLDKWLNNANCNATAPVVLSHYFVNKLISRKQRGCVVFTSSPANIIPSPFSTLYGATKSFITHFAMSLACECAPHGIDVSVVHPSPVATAFYTGAHALPTLHMFKGTATGPDRVADVMIRGVGRSVIIDQGYYPFLFRLMTRVLEVTSLADLIVVMTTTTADYKALKKATQEASDAASAKKQTQALAEETSVKSDTPARKRRGSSAGASRRK